MAWVTHSATASSFSTLSCIGPDGNLWYVTSSTGTIYQFNTTTFAVTAFTVTGAKQLTDVTTDGTYLYVTDQSTSSTANIYTVTTAGGSSSFYAGSIGFNFYNIYYDGTYLWATRNASLCQFNLAGSLLHTYAMGAGSKGGGLFSDGTYWWSDASSGGTGLLRGLVVSPGTAWTAITSGFTAGNETGCKTGTETAGSLWVATFKANFAAVVPSTGAVTIYAPSAMSGMQTLGVCFDGTSLWVAGKSSGTGIWQTTPSAPTVGTMFNLPAGFIFYQPSTKTVWAHGSGVIYQYAEAPPSNGNFSLVMVV